MKVIKNFNKISEGVRKCNNRYVFDYVEDKYDDLVYLKDPDIYEDKIFNNVYWFGYRFTDEASRSYRSDFINYIKGLLDTKPTEKELIRFIDKPLIKLHEKENITSINCIIHPVSERSSLVQKIVSEIYDVASRSAEKTTIELVKNLPKNITFDWKRFNDENAYDKQQQMFINDMINKIHSLDYFSLAKNVKPKYRKYIQNFLMFKTEEDKELYKSIQDGKILVVDDVNTSGSTLYEIVRILNELNSNCKIYIFTLIRK